MIPVYRMINRLANKQRREFERLSFPQKFSAAQGRVLHFLLNSPKDLICQKDIEDEFGLRPPSASSIIKSMEENNLILRVSSDKDARVKHIHLTDTAMKHADEINENMHQLDQRLTEGISPEDLAIWEKVSLQLMDNLKAN